MKKEKDQFRNIVRDMIYIHRKRNNLSQEKMAELLRISTRAYSDQENRHYGFSAMTFAAFLSSVSLEDIALIMAIICQEMDWEMHPTVSEAALSHLDKSEFKSLY